MTTKKTTNKKPVARKAANKKATAKKTQTSTKSGVKAAAVMSQPKTTSRASLPASYSQSTRRPPNTPFIPQQTIAEVTLLLQQAKEKLEAYAAHLRSLDRRRLNNIGVKREGFAQRAFRLAMDNPEFLPNYLARERYIDDYDYYVMMQSAVDVDGQVHELLRNINTENHDVFYTDGLDYYASVREAAKRRVDAAESIHEDLFTFFRHKKSSDAPETKKQQMRSIKGYVSGKKEGIAVIENIKPKTEGGVHKVIEEQYKDTDKFKDTVEGNFTE